jgi:hypothetical protein
MNEVVITAALRTAVGNSVARLPRCRRPIWEPTIIKALLAVPGFNRIRFPR